MRYTKTDPEIEAKVLETYGEDYIAIVDSIWDEYGPQYTASFFSDILLATVFDIAPEPDAFRTNMDNILSVLKGRVEQIVTALEDDNLVLTQPKN